MYKIRKTAMGKIRQLDTADQFGQLIVSAFAGTQIYTTMETSLLMKALDFCQQASHSRGFSQILDF
jgi:hypothetical protein